MSVNLRFRKLKSGKFSLYFDIYNDGKRWTETFTGGVVSKDYNQSKGYVPTCKNRLK